MKQETSHMNSLPLKEQYIFEKVSKLLFVPVDKILSNSRTRQVTEARFMLAYWYKCNTTLSLNKIASRLRVKKLYHTTVIHAIQKAKDLIDTDDFYRHVWNSIGAYTLTEKQYQKYKQLVNTYESNIYPLTTSMKYRPTQPHNPTHPLK